MEEEGGSGGGGATDTSRDGGAGGEQLLTVKHELRTGERPRPLPAGLGVGARPEGTQGSAWAGVTGPCRGRGGRALGGASRTGREPGGPGRWGRARGELAESFPQPGNERRARGVGARGAAHSCLLALTLRMSSRPLPAQVPHLSLHPV